MSWIQGLPARAIRQGLQNGDFLPHQIEEAQRRLTALTQDRPRAMIRVGAGDDRPRTMISLG